MKEDQTGGKDQDQGRDEGGGPPAPHGDFAAVEEYPEEEENQVVGKHLGGRHQANRPVGAENRLVHEVLGHQGEGDEEPPEGMAKLEARAGGDA